MKQIRWINAIFWGNSIALSWMWGLGLFFSVQMTFMFGLTGLLAFAIPNALGLFLFGLLTQKVAGRDRGGESLQRFFVRWSRPFRLSFYLYQVVAITLTIFAIVHYLFEPLLLPNRESGLVAYVLFICLTVLIVLSAACLFGEEFNIKSLKYGHLVQFTILAGAVGVILFGLKPFDFGTDALLEPRLFFDYTFLGYWIPVLVGFLVGPWLDLQQWQRAIQIHKESTSITGSYFWGSLQFFLLLLFHGGLALYVIKGFPGTYQVNEVVGLEYAHHLIVDFLNNPAVSAPQWVVLAYIVFLGVCILTTLDSGYVALKWFLTDHVNSSKNMLLSLIPKDFLASPIPTFIFAGSFTVVACVLRLELEYFMVFFATFFVGYEVLGIARCFVPNSQNPLPQIRMFAMGSLAVVVFAFGYFLDQPGLMMVSSILPTLYVLWLVFNTDLLRVVTEKAEEVIDAAAEIPGLRAIAKSELLSLSGKTTEVTRGSHFEGKWFVHHFMTSYSDTNSVGNVYFAMYAMFVGKAREMFFNVAMPGFDLKTTDFYILTRSFEHKFIRESREFEMLTVKIRVSEYNRKFVTMEHIIYDSSGQTLGKGSQHLFFVAAKDYRPIDIPQQVLTAFMPYL
jgi:acyl-CoA thioesterase FadM